MSKRRKYSTEFKPDAVELTRMEGVSVSQIAKDLGIGANMLSRWRRKLAADGNKAFGVNFDKEVVSRVLAKHYPPKPYKGGLSWLTFLRHISDSLWSIALFWCEAILLKTHSILAAIGQFIRRIIGYGISGCHLRKLLGVGQTQTVLIFPRSPPFAERRIVTRRRKHQDDRSYCSAIDLETEDEELNNAYHLFLMPSLLDKQICKNQHRGSSRPRCGPKVCLEKAPSRRASDLSHRVTGISSCTGS